MQRENEVAEYERTIGQLRQQLLAAIAQWKEQYAVIAPMDGIVSLQGYWSKGQHVTVGSALASIVPEKETEVIGRMEVPSAGFGKVETGQTVNVKLNGFPYMEYGVLKGTIRSISSVPASVQTATGTTIAYTVEVVFPEGMRTTYDKELPMIQQMDGRAKSSRRICALSSNSYNLSYRCSKTADHEMPHNTIVRRRRFGADVVRCNTAQRTGSATLDAGRMYRLCFRT